MYEANLDYWPAVEEVLKVRPAAGSLKKVGHQFGGSAAGWHYTGSFWWARSADLFSRDWRRFDRQSNKVRA